MRRSRGLGTPDEPCASAVSMLAITVRPLHGGVRTVSSLPRLHRRMYIARGRRLPSAIEAATRRGEDFLSVPLRADLTWCRESQVLKLA